MTPEPVMLNEAQVAKLAGANGHAIPLCNPGGGVVAYGVSPERLAKLEDAYRAQIAELDRIWTPELLREIIERRKADTRPKIPHEEVMRWIESL